MALYINGEKIEEAEIQAEMKRLRPQHERLFPEMPDENRERQLHRWARETMIRQTVLRQAAKKRLPEVDAADVEEIFEEYVEGVGGKEEFLKKLGDDPDPEGRTRRTIEGHIRLKFLFDIVTLDVPKATYDEVRRFYESNLAYFTAPETVHAFHIVRNVNADRNRDTALEEIKKAKEELDNGADFCETARKHSDCPDRGGDLGFIAPGQMVPEFEKVIFNLGIGETSDVFETPFGFHIAKTVEKKPETICPLASVKDSVAKGVTEERQRDKIKSFIEQEKAASIVEERE